MAEECLDSIFITTGSSTGGTNNLKILDVLNWVLAWPTIELRKEIFRPDLSSKFALSSGNRLGWLSSAMLASPICLRVSLSPMVKVPVSKEVVRVSESESDQSKGLLSDATLASSARRLACLVRRKVRSISGSNNNKPGSECDLSIHITIHRSKRQCYAFRGLRHFGSRPTKKIKGIAENMLVRIGQLMIPVDFHVIMPTKGDKGGRPQVLLGRPFLKTTKFKLIYYDEIFTFSVGNVIEIFHLTTQKVPEVKKEGPRRKHKVRIRDSPKERISHEKGSRNPPPYSNGKKKKVPLDPKKKKKKKKEPDEDRTEKKKMLKCLSFDRLLGKLKVLKDVLHRNKSMDAHLVKTNPKWK
ncbi:hypothetical protein PIB30_108779 [Stylosanthes scabra]|uniref:Uncharacterized protein n=1 Tax=Stylosanthes scabra TaxID=79078 RepID=A0ABU6ZY42_9FABA|nr:hypothetical protein [Stylosanthes scabra]